MQGNPGFSQSTNNSGNKSNTLNSLFINDNYNNNDNYRKPFKPIVGGDFGNNNANLIDFNIL